MMVSKSTNVVLPQAGTEAIIVARQACGKREGGKRETQSARREAGGGEAATVGQSDGLTAGSGLAGRR